jgi:hypothetical protein
MCLFTVGGKQKREHGNFLKYGRAGSNLSEIFGGRFDKKFEYATIKALGGRPSASFTSKVQSPKLAGQGDVQLLFDNLQDRCQKPEFGRQDPGFRRQKAGWRRLSAGFPYHWIQVAREAGFGSRKWLVSREVRIAPMKIGRVLTFSHHFSRGGARSLFPGNTKRSAALCRDAATGAECAGINLGGIAGATGLAMPYRRWNIFERRRSTALPLESGRRDGLVRFGEREKARKSGFVRFAQWQNVSPQRRRGAKGEGNGALAFRTRFRNRSLESI